MNKGLEKLARIKGHFNPKDIANKELFEEDFNTIEKELKDKEKQDKFIEVLKPYLKDIIGMNVYDRDFVEYFIYTKNGRKIISEDIYDLIKGNNL